MDDALKPTSQELPLSPEPAVSPPEPSAPPAPAPDPAPRTGARSETRARVSKPAAKTGKRPRKTAPVEDAAAPEEDRVAVVLKTSKYTGRNGRAVARKTTVLVTLDRALKLIMLDDAREATDAEKAAAVVYLD